MANGAPKQHDDEFEAATSVMESGLLRVLKQTSKEEEAGDTTETELPPVLTPLVSSADPRPLVEPVELPVLAESAEPPAPASDRTSVVAIPPRRRSRVILVAGIVAAVVVVADAALFVVHRHATTTRRAAAPPAQLPSYMVLPESAPAEKPAAPEPPAAAAAAVADAAPLATAPDEPAPPRAHKRSHHRHSRR